MNDVDWELPDFSAEMFREKKTRFCVCVFVLNEGERLLAQLERMRPFAALADVLVVDGGSDDGATAARNLIAREVRGLLVARAAGGLSAQMRAGMAFALRQGYEGVIVMDGNNKDEPEAIPRFLAALAEGFDHIQGSRYLPGGRAVNTPLERTLGIRLIHAPLISLAAGFRYTDTTNGFRAYSARLLEDPRVAPFRRVFMTYELHYYLSVRAARLGYRVREIPVAREYPATGPTPTKIKSPAAHWNVIRKLVQSCTGHFDPRAPKR
jgi:dolichol-phosphate mannosyltransferase